MIQSNEGVIYREKFKISPFRKDLEKLFASRQKYKDEGNDLMQGLVIIILNSLYGVQIRRDIDEFFKCKPQHWMETEYNENVLHYWKIPNGNFTVELEKDIGLVCDNDDLKTYYPLI